MNGSFPQEKPQWVITSSSIRSVRVAHDTTCGLLRASTTLAAGKVSAVLPQGLFACETLVHLPPISVEPDKEVLEDRSFTGNTEHQVPCGSFGLVVLGSCIPGRGSTGSHP